MQESKFNRISKDDLFTYLYLLNKHLVVREQHVDQSVELKEYLSKERRESLEVIEKMQQVLAKRVMSSVNKQF